MERVRRLRSGPGVQTWGATPVQVPSDWKRLSSSPDLDAAANLCRHYSLSTSTHSADILLEGAAHAHWGPGKSKAKHGLLFVSIGQQPGGWGARAVRGRLAFSNLVQRKERLQKDRLQCSHRLTVPGSKELERDGRMAARMGSFPLWKPGSPPQAQ